MKKYLKEDFLNLEPNYRRNLINSIAGFKSLNLIGTIDEVQSANLAIFNSVIHVGSDPPLLGMLVRPPVVPRHTLTNIRQRKFYTINHITEEVYVRAHQTGAKYQTEVSEFDAVGLKPWFSETFSVPYVTESPVKIGLELKEELEIKANCTVFLVGEIVELHIKKEAILGDGLINLSFINTLTGSGIDSYYKTIPLKRLSHPKPDSDLETK